MKFHFTAVEVLATLCMVRGKDTWLPAVHGFLLWTGHLTTHIEEEGQVIGESLEDIPLKYILTIRVYGLNLALGYKSVFDTSNFKLVITPNFEQKPSRVIGFLMELIHRQLVSWKGLDE